MQTASPRGLRWFKKKWNYLSLEKLASICLIKCLNLLLNWLGGLELSFTLHYFTKLVLSITCNKIYLF